MFLGIFLGQQLRSFPEMAVEYQSLVGRLLSSNISTLLVNNQQAIAFVIITEKYLLMIIQRLISMSP